MANKKALVFDSNNIPQQLQTGDTLDLSLGLGLPVAGSGTGASTALGARTNLGAGTLVDSYQALGSSICAQAYDPILISTTGTLVTGSLNLVYLGNAIGDLILGGKWYQTTQGVYTASSNNKIGIYSYSAGTFTLAASSANTAALWKATSGTFASQALSSSYQAVYGTAYFFAWLWNASATTTTPVRATLLSNTVIGSGQNTLDFTNSVASGLSLAAQTDLPSTIAASSMTINSTRAWCALYK